MPHDIFISYSRRDKNIVSQIVNELKSNHLSCWMDTAPGCISSGTPDFFESIRDGIRESKVFFVFHFRVIFDEQPSEKGTRDCAGISERRVAIQEARPPVTPTNSVVSWRSHRVHAEARTVVKQSNNYLGHSVKRYE